MEKNINQFNVKGEKEGYWEEDKYSHIWKGSYLNNYYHGIWKIYNKDSILVEKSMYNKGVMIWRKFNNEINANYYKNLFYEVHIEYYEWI